MRPIDKGPWPVQKRSSNTKLVFNDWKKAIPHLKQKTGEYCHFCEMAVNHQIAIEHIKSRDDYPKLKNNWANFLLGCSHCNSNKGTKRIISPYRKVYFWPHIHNTMLAFEVPLHGPDVGKVQPHKNLSNNTQLQNRAKRTISLYELDKTVKSDGSSDRRFILRMKAIQMATTRYTEYAQGKTTIQAIVDMAELSGFFTVWYTVFYNIPAVKNALKNAPCFHLNNSWFDASLNPIPRTTNDFI
ncbi:HNH endonuclease [Aeromonas veronii]|uniref:HNH endonuclease n=1 Tax=Aeromonas veronii TaxID=654 RepID=UPI0011ED4F2A|nr:HNH endonuclease [Aeromonas veronii]